MNKCLWCGKDVKNKFCNVSCQNRYQKRKPTTEQIKKGQITRFGEFKIFKVTCSKCGQEIEVKEREKLHPQKEKYYCSRKCANSHTRTEESKIKTSNSIKKLILDGKQVGFINNKNINRHKKVKKEKIKKEKIKEYKICNECNTNFIIKEKNQIFCSQQCSRKSNIRLASLKQQETHKNNPTYWSEINKKSYKNGKNYVAGGTTKWLNYKDIKVQGTYELRTCYILDKWKENKIIKDWKYSKDRINYIGIDDKQHTYIIDFKIFNDDGTFYYLEIKGWVRENDELKWKTVRNNGYKLDVWFIQDIKKIENDLNIKWIRKINSYELIKFKEL